MRSLYFDSAAALCGDTLDALATSTITRSVLRRTEQGSRLLYQFLYRRAAPLRPYAALDIYNAQGVCLYTTDTSLPAAIVLVQAASFLLLLAWRSQRQKAMIKNNHK